ncbi:MAG TPA: helix-turn-helix transcriptional regulator [Bacteroidales bacterium]|nr:helix-turn-helix transcriptional regulator [Bacteroidales bacterium]
MKERIQLLIKAKNFTAAQFADEIGVQKSGVSHIISGRNNPSLDFVQKILTRFPEVSTDWLLFGRGPMMLSDVPATFSLPPVAVPASSSGKLADLFSQDIAPVEVSVKPVKVPEKLITDSVPVYKTAIDEPGEKESGKPQENITIPVPKDVKNQEQAKVVTKIIVLYDDKTFSEYHPED